MIRQLIVLLSIITSSYGSLVFASDPREQLYDLQVKGLGEFMARFNSVEHIFEDLPLPYGVTQRAKDIMTVCDNDMANKDPMYSEIISGFIDTVERDSIMLNFADTTWYACAFCKIQYNKKPIEVNLLLAPYEVVPNRFTWVIEDVGGKDISQIADTTKYVGISPTDNELDFIDLVKKSQSNRKNFAGHRRPGRDIDYLSAFVSLVQAGVITIDGCSKITYYFLSVPGYVFTVDNLLRDSSNSGWLISSITPIDESQKYDYLRIMYNY